MDDIKETNNVWVLQFFEQGNFSNRRARDALVFRFESNLFESYNLPRDTIFRFIDNPFESTNAKTNELQYNPR